jgi:hypothetical protein
MVVTDSVSSVTLLAAELYGMTDAVAWTTIMTRSCMHVVVQFDAERSMKVALDRAAERKEADMKELELKLKKAQVQSRACMSFA